MVGMLLFLFFIACDETGDLDLFLSRKLGEVVNFVIDSKLL